MGPARAASAVAIINHQKNSHGWTGMLEAVDGAKVSGDAIQVLSGRHAFTVSSGNLPLAAQAAAAPGGLGLFQGLDRQAAQTRRTLTQTVAAGKVYTVRCDAAGKNLELK
jgi:hypothetical protein